ncbi:MAG: type VI secretion system baseplate subunit TssG [Pyrinomonadaceae bacterium]
MKESPLRNILLEEPYRFEFFQAVRLLEKLAPKKKPVGGNALPHEEIVRFRSRIALDFPASEIQEITERTDANTSEQTLEMFENFMAMAGVSGVLPTHYTELLYSRIRYRDTAMWAFLDIFTHRAVSLFYRAWAKYRIPVAYESGDNSFRSYLFDFVGLGTQGLRGRMSLEDESLLPYAGLISQKPHSLSAVENMVSDYFGIPVKIEQFFGQWLELSPSDLTLMGKANHKLGFRTIAGTRIWDQRSKYRVRLGPLTITQYLAFLPVGSAYKPLYSLLRFVNGNESDFDVSLELIKEQIPATILTTRAKRRPMLGWTSFLKSQPAASNDNQLVLAG